MLVFKHGDIDTVISIEEFYSHEMRIAKLPFLGAGPIKLQYIHEKDTNENNRALLAMLLILQNLQTRRSVSKIHVEFDYMPFSRMDKEDAQFEETLKPFLTLLNPLIDFITTNSIHSKTMFYAIFNEKFIDLESQYVYKTTYKRQNSEDYALVAVDDGVLKRHRNLYFDIAIKKVRDKGTIVDQYISEKDKSIAGIYKNFIFIDDICSKGTTFLNAGKLIKEINPHAKLHLYVDFMESSAFEAGLTAPLFELFDTVEYGKLI